MSSFLSTNIASATGKDYYKKWCKEVGRRLETAVRNANHSQTYNKEKKVLLTAVTRSIKETPAKNNYYFLQTLEQIVDGVNNYNRVQDQVYYLRAYTRYALHDLWYIDQALKGDACFFCGKDHSSYVATILQRGLTEGEASLEDNTEKRVLNQMAKKASYYLDRSSYRRNYACARSELLLAIDVDDVMSKREHIRKTIWILKNNCR